MKHSNENRSNETDYIYGRNTVLSYLRAEQPVNRVMISKAISSQAADEVVKQARKRGVEVRMVKPEEINALAPHAVHQGFVAYAAACRYSPWEDMIERARAANEPLLLVMLDGVTDSMNIGSVIRSACAAGAHGLILPKRRAGAVNAAASKASAGAAARLPIARVPNLAQVIRLLQKQGVWIVAADPSGDTTYDQIDYTIPMTMVFGSEDSGVSRLLLDKSDWIASIPMHQQTDSLNVAVAAGVFLFEAAKQRSKKRSQV